MAEARRSAVSTTTATRRPSCTSGRADLGVDRAVEDGQARARPRDRPQAGLSQRGTTYLSRNAFRNVPEGSCRSRSAANSGSRGYEERTASGDIVKSLPQCGRGSNGARAASIDRQDPSDAVPVRLPREVERDRRRGRTRCSSTARRPRSSGPRRPAAGARTGRGPRRGARSASTACSRGIRYSVWSSAPALGVWSIRKCGRRSCHGPGHAELLGAGVRRHPADRVDRDGRLGRAEERPAAARRPVVRRSTRRLSQTCSNTGPRHSVNRLTLSASAVISSKWSATAPSGRSS